MRIVHYRNPYSYRSFSPAFSQSWADFDSEIERLVSSAFGASDSSFTGVPVNVHSDKDKVYVRAELPGVAREQLQLEFEENALSISVNAAKTEGDAGATQAQYKRSIQVPVDVVSDKISASLQDGILTVTLPKQEQVKPRKIAINVN